MKQQIRKYVFTFSMFIFAITQLYLFYKMPVEAVVEIVAAGTAIFCVNQEFEEIE